jgi:hypothetical protein
VPGSRMASAVPGIACPVVTPDGTRGDRPGQAGGRYQWTDTRVSTAAALLRRSGG